MLNLTVLKELGTIVSSTIGSAISHPNYSFNKDKIVEGGPYTGWKLVSARTVKTDQVVTLFTFDKKDLDEAHIQTQIVLDSLRTEALSLQKLRHPKILNIVDPLVEDKFSLDFSTKPVLGTLEAFKHRLCTLEIKSGILDICEALRFLHKNASLVHLNVNPYTIYIDESGRWLLGGMSVTKEIKGGKGEAQCDLPFSGPRTLSNGKAVSVDPPLNYTAPEATQSPHGRCSAASDVFSLALVALECMATAINVGPSNLIGSWAPPPMTSKARHQQEMMDFLRKLHSRTSQLPSALYDLLMRMLDPNPNLRPYVDALETSTDFNNVALRALKFCDAFAEKDDVQKYEFLKAFHPMMITNAELQNSEILRTRILPRLISSLSLKFMTLIPLVLKPSLWIVAKLNDAELFKSLVWPHIEPLLNAPEIQIESVVLLLDSLGTLVALSSADIQTTQLIPFMMKCLAIPNSDIQRSVLEQLPMLFKHNQDGTLKINVLPKILDMISHERCSPKLRCDGVKVLSEVSEYLDRTSVMHFVLPAVQQISRIDRTGETTAALFILLDSLRAQMGTELSVSHILAVAMPLLTNPLLDSDSYFKCHGIVEDTLAKFHSIKCKEFEQKKESQGVVSSVLNIPTVSPPTIDVWDDGVRAESKLDELLDFPTTPPPRSGGFKHTNNQDEPSYRDKKSDTKTYSVASSSSSYTSKRRNKLGRVNESDLINLQDVESPLNVTKPISKSITSNSQNKSGIDALFQSVNTSSLTQLEDIFAPATSTTQESGTDRVAAAFKDLKVDNSKDPFACLM